MKMSQKLRAIRKAEGLTQAKFCELTGLAISTLKNYEGEHREPGIQIVTQIVNTPLFKKYTLWIMTDETAPQAGQIAPAFAHIGRESTESDHSEKQTG